MWEYLESNELYHYGVKGMKWGVVRVKEDADRTNDRSIVGRRFHKKALRFETARQKYNEAVTGLKYHNPVTGNTIQIKPNKSEKQIERLYSSAIKNAERVTKAANKLQKRGYKVDLDMVQAEYAPSGQVVVTTYLEKNGKERVRMSMADSLYGDRTLKMPE